MMIIYFIALINKRKVLNCLLWHLGHQSVVPPGHEKIRTFFYAKCSISKHKIPIFPKITSFQLLIFKSSSFRQKDMFIMHIHSKYS